MTASTSPNDQERLSPDFWEGRYQTGTTRWDLGQAAPPLMQLLQQPDSPPSGKTVMLGCGRGYDALLFARHGFEVLGVDFAPSAIAAATQLAKEQPSPAQFMQCDIFDLLPTYHQAFDYVVEHTCFCALAPELRDRYVRLVHQLLKPGGQFIGLFFTHGRPGGPPYGSHPDELRQLFGQQFEILSLAPAQQSVPSRQGEEHVGIFQKAASMSDG